jgi:hypothetical protein
MALNFRTCYRVFLLILLFHPLLLLQLSAKDYYVTGTVIDSDGNIVPDARVSMIAGTTEYASTTGTDGRYSLRISGIYEEISGIIEAGSSFPNPFTSSVNIPFIINTSGDIRFSVYNFSGQKVMETTFYSTYAGSYRLIWDGCSQNGTVQNDGFYFYVITFKGKSVSGKIIKAAGFSSFSAGTALEPVMMPPATQVLPGQLRFKVVTSVTCQNYYPVRLTDITIARDTIIDFEITRKQSIPYKTKGDHIAMYTGSDYRSLVLKGINLGSSPPGFFPGEIAYAISPSNYEEWIKNIAEAGFNSIRIYTLHPPVFYEKLAEYNQRHSDNPLLLFQGIWLEEVEDRYDPASWDLMNRVTPFTKEIHEVIDCINGKGDMAYRYGRAYGRYLTDVSRWTASYIIGREISPQEVDSTNSNHPELTSYTGSNLAITGASATEVFVTRMLEETISYEENQYSVKRPVSISSWPTLDPLHHPTEIHTDEDKADFDISKITLSVPEPGIFASFHAYPYYPNFISQQPSYLTYSDNQGPNSYLGYLNDLKSHYNGMPLVIAEFGVPSSWGSAHQSYSKMHHGGFSELQQGEIDMRLIHNIINTGCAGGFMFAWMDEWFKPTWIVLYLEAYGMLSDGITIPTRQLWQNLTSPEQNFGLFTFDEISPMPLVSYDMGNTSGPLKNLSATNDNRYFFLEVETKRPLLPGDTVSIAFDTYLKNLGESVLPNGKLLPNRSEFLLSMILSEDTASYYVTTAYDMNGLTPRFDLSNHAVQKFRSTVSDGAGWTLMQWTNDEYSASKQDIGRLPIENSSSFTSGKRTAVAWSNDKMKIRIPWTLLYFRDPTQMQVIDGAVSYDGGYNYEISTALSDGIAVSVYFDHKVTSSLSRYTWPHWLAVPSTTPAAKKSFQVIKEGLSSIPGFTD